MTNASGNSTNMWNKLCIIVGPRPGGWDNSNRELRTVLSESMGEKGGPGCRDGGILSGLSLWAKGVWSRLSTEVLSNLSEYSAEQSKVPSASLLKVLYIFFIYCFKL